MPILAKKKKIIFSDKAHFDIGGYVNKQNCRIWGTENPIHPKRVTVWSLRILVQRHNWAIFSSKMNKDRPLQTMTIVIGPCSTNFCSQKLKLNWQHTGFNHTAETTLDVLRPVYEDRITSRRARSCDLTPLDYYLWVAVKDKYYADKSDTIVMQ